MAVTYTVTRSRADGPLTVKGKAKENTLSGSQTLTYDVEVTDPEDPAFNPFTISEADVFTQALCPVVNRSIYSYSGIIVPFFICRSKTVRRNPKIAARFKVECGFEFDGQTASDPQAEPEALTDIAPKVESTIEEIPIVIYRDYADPPVEILTPNGNFYSEGMVTRFPVHTLRIIQYEAAMTFAQQLERSLRFNSTAYRSQAATMWMSETVIAAEAQVQLAGGSIINAVQATYTLRLSPFTWGWKESRLLIDTHYRPSAGLPPVPFIDTKANAFKQGFINTDGTALAGTTPAYQYFQQQPSIDYTTFLQV